MVIRASLVICGMSYFPRRRSHTQMSLGVFLPRGIIWAFGAGIDSHTQLPHPIGLPKLFAIWTCSICTWLFLFDVAFWNIFNLRNAFSKDLNTSVKSKCCRFWIQRSPFRSIWATRNAHNSRGYAYLGNLPVLGDGHQNHREPSNLPGLLFGVQSFGQESWWILGPFEKNIGQQPIYLGAGSHWGYPQDG